MTIEPSAVRFTVGTKVIPPKHGTLDDYQATILARFGKLPSMAELAKGENAVMRTARDSHGSAGMTSEGRGRIGALRRADGQRTLAILLDAMTEPMTRSDLSRKTGIAESTITHAMIRAQHDGLVKRTTVHRFAIWERVA